VRDEGIGMDSEQQAALFDLSAVRSRAGTANERGSGFGLVLCKEILELHGGSIEASSEPARGVPSRSFSPIRRTGAIYSPIKSDLSIPAFNCQFEASRSALQAMTALSSSGKRGPAV